MTHETLAEARAALLENLKLLVGPSVLGVEAELDTYTQTVQRIERGRALALVGCGKNLAAFIEGMYG